MMTVGELQIILGYLKPEREIGIVYDCGYGYANLEFVNSQQEDEVIFSGSTYTKQGYEKGQTRLIPNKPKEKTSLT